jgi:hypothetical protein
MQVSARWRLNDWAVVSDSRNDFQAAGFVDRQNVAGAALTTVVARTIQTHLAAPAVVDVALVHVQALSVIPITKL